MKKTLALLVCVVMLLQTLPALAYQPSSTFTDLTGYEFYADEAKALSEKGILVGYDDGSFGGDRLIERSEMAAFICRMLGKADEESDFNFDDVSKDHWAYKNISTAASLGIILGDGDGKFRPDDHILFEEAVKMVVVAAGLEDLAKEKGGWPNGYIKVANIYNLLTKNNKEIGEEVTRIDVATTIYNALNIENRTLVDFGMPKVYNKTIEGTTKERFEQRVSELPTEVRVLEPRDTTHKKEVFVAPTGSDDGDGSIDKPFKTLQKALEFSEDSTIYLRGGAYNNSETLEIKNVKGTVDNPVYISAYKDEEPVIVGGYSLKAEDFTKISDSKIKDRLKANIRNEVIEVDLTKYGIDSVPDISSSSYGTALHINGGTINIARYPNSGLLQVEKVVDRGPVANLGEKNDGRGFTIGFVTDRTPFNWVDTGNIWVRGGFYWEWHQVYTPIKINYDESTITSKYASYYGVRRTGEYFFYNVLEELDAPNEYFIDRDTMKMYLLPSKDLTNDDEIYLSLINDQIVSVDDCKNVIFNGIKFTASVADGVKINRSEDIIFQNSIISSCGQRGIHIDADSKRVGATCCYFMNNRNQNVRSAERSNRKKLEPTNNFVQNCIIFGNSDQILNSLVSITGVGDVISHNLFANGYATAIGFGGWEGLIEYNETTASPKYQVDSGAMYGGGFSGILATHVRYNYFHSVDKSNKNNMTQGTYFDSRAHDDYSYGNVMEGLPGGAYNNGGKFIVFYNNLHINSNIADNKGKAYNCYDYYVDGGDDLSGGGFLPNVLSGDHEYTSEMKERMPYYTDLLDKHQELIKEWGGKEEYTHSALETELRTSSDNYVANNVSVNGGISGFKQSIVDASEFKDNVLYTEDPGFVDFENRDFNVKEDSEIYEDVPEFKAPDFDNMRLKTNLMNREVKLGMFGGIEAVSPRNGKTAEVGKYGIEFKWTDLFLATDYVFELATDKDFTNIVKTEKLNKEFLTTDLPEAGKTYYWRVTAYTSAESADRTPLISPVFTFTNMTDEEMAEFITPDYGVLSSKIDIANVMIEEYEEKGYGEEEIKALEESKNKAVQFVKEKHTKEEIDVMLEEIKKLIVDAKKSEEYKYIDIDLDADHWNLTGDMTAENNADGELVLTPNSGNPHAISMNNTSYGKMYRFQMYLEDHQDWFGITPTYDIETKHRYFFVPNVHQIECQKVIAGTRVGFLDIVENNGLLKTGVWQEVEVGNIIVDGGAVWVFLRIDGKTVIDALDTENVIQDDGGFQFLLNAKNGYIKIRPSQIPDSELPPRREQ